jgi:DUF971 family protein
VRCSFAVHAHVQVVSMNGPVKKTLQDKNISDDLTFKHTSIVGRYALNFHFSDGHDTGIFSFKFLREL